MLKLEKDERLVAMIRGGHEGAFEILFDRYHARLLAFCSSMLRSRQDAEDVLQEVFANAHKAMLADDRRINVRPWLYRIARNRCLNHLRKPVPEGQDSMDIHPHLNGTTTAERVQNREELRQVLADVGHLPETQRSALLLREIDQLSYEDIAVAMETTIPAVKSLLVRARITLAESSEARTLSCDEVRLTLAEAAEGISKATGPVRQHVRNCEGCSGFRDQLRSDRKALAALLPIGPLAVLKIGLIGKLFGGGSAAGGTAAGSAGAASAGTAAGAIGGSAAAGTGATAGGLGALGGAIGTKAAAGVATAALLTAGAVEVKKVASGKPASPPAVERVEAAPPPPEPPKKDRAPAKAAAAVGLAAAGAGAAATDDEASAEEPVAEDAPAERAMPDADASGEASDSGETTAPSEEFEDEQGGTPVEPIDRPADDSDAGDPVGDRPATDGESTSPEPDPGTPEDESSAPPPSDPTLDPTFDPAQPETDPGDDPIASTSG